MQKFYFLNYEEWYAAALFYEVGYPLADILLRLKITENEWQDSVTRYNALREEEIICDEKGTLVRSDDSDKLAQIYKLITNNATYKILPQDEPHSIIIALRKIRNKVRQQPHIGVFSNAPYTYIFLGERFYPHLVYHSNGDGVRCSYYKIGNEPGHLLHDKAGKLLNGIDVKSFKQLGKRWFCDDEQVYCQGETATKTFWYIVKKADPKTFEVLNLRYAADKNAGYYVTNRRFPTKDKGSFAVLGYPYGNGIIFDKSAYAKDSQYVYAYGKIIKEADAATFHPIGDEGKYFADKNHIYYQISPIEGADLASFTCVPSTGYGRAYDKNTPYFTNMPISINDAFKDFTEYFESHPEITDTWWHKEKARRESPETITEPENIGGRFYSNGRVIMVKSEGRSRQPEYYTLDTLDTDTFRYIVDMFAADKNGLHYVRHHYEKYTNPVIKNGDPLSLKAIGDGWYKDRNQVYFIDENAFYPTLKICKADLASFEWLGGHYARDKNGLIFEGVRKKNVLDTNDIKGIGFTYAIQGDIILSKASPIKAQGKLDLATIKVYHRYLVMDGEGNMLINNLYRKPIEGLDIASFRMVKSNFAVDKHRLYAIGDMTLAICSFADLATLQIKNDGKIFDQNGEIKYERHLNSFKRL